MAQPRASFRLMTMQTAVSELCGFELPASVSSREFEVVGMTGAVGAECPSTLVSTVPVRVLWVTLLPATRCTSWTAYRELLVQARSDGEHGDYERMLALLKGCQF